MKKLLVILLALVMVLSIAACGGTNDDTTPSDGTNPPDTTPEDTTPQGPADGEEIPYTPLYYNGFEEVTDDLLAIHQAPVAEDPNLTGATYALSPSVHEIVISDGYGAKGNSLILDGKYGVSIQNFPKTADDTYTIAFWYAADRYSQYAAIVQMGHNIGMADDVAWVNFTKADTWSVTGEEAAPVVWNRNSNPSTNGLAVWPWIGNNADLKGKKEWVHVALVVDGEAYEDATGLSHVGATVYINGVEVMKADSSVIGTTDEAGNDTSANWMGVAPEIFSVEGIYGIECLLGLNYWDQYSKLYLDEFYFYDEALTAGQIATLYADGTAPAYQSQPAYEGPTDEEPETVEPEPTPAAPVDENAIDTLGTTDRVLGFWTDNTDGFELADGATVTLTLNNYSDGVNNWDNFVLAFTNTAVTTDLLASADNYAGYAEYAVLRADAFGWGDAAYAGVFETSWGDDWAGWLAMMTEAKVEVVITRAGGEITVNYTFTGADGSVWTETAVITSTLTADAPCYVHITGEGAYIELLSVE